MVDEFIYYKLVINQLKALIMNVPLMRCFCCFLEF